VNVSPIVTNSQKISFKENHKELFLLDLIKSNKIWENENLWISLNRSIIEEEYVKWEDGFLKNNQKYSICRIISSSKNIEIKQYFNL